MLEGACATNDHAMPAHAMSLDLDRTRSPIDWSLQILHSRMNSLIINNDLTITLLLSVCWCCPGLIYNISVFSKFCQYLCSKFCKTTGKSVGSMDAMSVRYVRYSEVLLFFLIIGAESKSMSIIGLQCGRRSSHIKWSTIVQNHRRVALIAIAACCKLES